VVPISVSADFQEVHGYLRAIIKRDEVSERALALTEMVHNPPDPPDLPDPTNPTNPSNPTNPTNATNPADPTYPLSIRLSWQHNTLVSL
jgi:hypothetical protein